VDKKQQIVDEVSRLPEASLDNALALIRMLARRNGAYETAVLSEAALAKDWNTPEEDEAWKDL